LDIWQLCRRIQPEGVELDLGPFSTAKPLECGDLSPLWSRAERAIHPDGVEWNSRGCNPREAVRGHPDLSGQRPRPNRPHLVSIAAAICISSGFFRRIAVCPFSAERGRYGNSRGRNTLARIRLSDANRNNQRVTNNALTDKCACATAAQSVVWA